MENLHFIIFEEPNVPQERWLAVKIDDITAIRPEGTQHSTIYLSGGQTLTVAVSVMDVLNQMGAYVERLGRHL